MAESKLQGLSQDPKHYLKTFQVFAMHSDKFKILVNWVDNVFSNEVLANLSVKLNENEEFRVLGVGSGSGEMESKMLSTLLQKYPRITNRVVEPAKDQIVLYKALVQSNAHELQGVQFDWRHQTLDQYKDTDGDGTKFQFISAVHSMYYVDDADSSLMYLYDLLEPGGKLLVITLSEKSDVGGLWRHSSTYHAHPVKITTADVRSFLDRHNIAYTHNHQKSWVKITKCLDETSEDGNLLLDFLIHIVKFKETATDAHYKEVVKYLLSSGSYMEDGVEVFCSNDWDALIINKPE